MTTLKFAKGGLSNTFGMRYLSAVVHSKDMFDFSRSGDIEYLFTGAEVEVYHFIRSFSLKHGAIPSAETVENHTKVKLVPPSDPVSYHRELLENRNVDNRLKMAMKEASEMLGNTKTTPKDALEHLTQTVMELHLRSGMIDVVDYRDASALLKKTYVDNVMTKAEAGMLTGWPTLDKMSNGLRRGDLLSIVGRPASGKSWMLVSAAYHSWRKGNSALFVSMEMTPTMILQRLSAVDTTIPMSHIQKEGMTANEWKKYLSALNGAAEQEKGFYVLDGNLASTVEDIWLAALALKVDTIWIDGGYLVKHPTVKDRFTRVAENADLMKQELAAMAPTAVSWQFARSAVKGKGKTKSGQTEVPGLEDIGYTDAIPQISSIVLGLLQEETIETLNKKTVRIMKGRSGEVGEFPINWKFAPQMNFSEIEEVEVSKLEYI